MSAALLTVLVTALRRGRSAAAEHPTRVGTDLPRLRAPVTSAPSAGDAPGETVIRTRHRHRGLRGAQRAARITVQVLLWFGSALGIAAVAMAAASVLFGLTPLVFQSGSMAPAYNTGDLGFAQEVSADRLRVGDVVTVVDGRDVRVTHRIVDIDHFEDHAALTLRGDANEAADPRTIAVTSADRLLFRVPTGGFVIDWLMSPPGMLTAGLLVGFLVFVGFVLPPRMLSVTARPRRARRRVRAAVVAAAVALVASTIATPPADRTLAYWTDSAAATTGGFAAYTVASPTTAATPCTANNQLITRRVTVRWNGVAPPPAPAPVAGQHEYVVRVYNRNTNALVDTRVIPHSGAPGAVHETFYTSSILNLFSGTTPYRVEVESRLMGTNPAWTGANIETINFVANSSLLFGVTYTCQS